MGIRDDILVVGNGPAGLAIAAACAERGLRVSVAAPDHDRRWPQTFGVWCDELDPIGLGGTFANRWPAVGLHLDEAAPRQLARPYGRIDNERLRRLLATRAERAGARQVTATVTGVEHDRAGSVVATTDGARLACRVVVDAAGHRPALLDATTGRPPAVQTAYGVVGRFSNPPVAFGTIMLMDFRSPGPSFDADPTFLYAMDLGDGSFLVEETSLARRPPLPTEALEARLHARLAARGTRMVEQARSERVAIPMGGALPSRRQRVVGFGSAAGMVQPATGYQVGTALTRAPAVAAALARAFGQPDAHPDTLSRAAWEAVWPDDLVAQRALHCLGLEVLVELDRTATQRFFRAFFDLPQQRWERYLSGERSARALAATMLTLFARAPTRLRAELVRIGVREASLLREAACPGR